VPAAAARKRAQDVLAGAPGSALDTGARDAPKTLRKAFDKYLEEHVKARTRRLVEHRRGIRQLRFRS
jgi:hypothetical protein